MRRKHLLKQRFVAAKASAGRKTHAKRQLLQFYEGAKESTLMGLIFRRIGLSIEGGMSPSPCFTNAVSRTRVRKANTSITRPLCWKVYTSPAVGQQGAEVEHESRVSVLLKIVCSLIEHDTRPNDDTSPVYHMRLALANKFDVTDGCVVMDEALPGFL